MRGVKSEMCGACGVWSQSVKCGVLSVKCEV